jgi:hypothetical protein
MFNHILCKLSPTIYICKPKLCNNTSELEPVQFLKKSIIESEDINISYKICGRL